MRKLIEKFYEKIGLSNDQNYPPSICQVLSWVTYIGIIIFIFVRIGAGMRDANDPQKCNAQTINDVVLSPAYAIGCNLAKNRFNIKLN